MASAKVIELANGLPTQLESLSTISRSIITNNSELTAVGVKIIVSINRAIFSPLKMKRLYLTAALFIFGIVTPLVTAATHPIVAVAQPNNSNANNLDGTFVDREWTVGVSYRNNTYHYTGRQGKSSIELAGATVLRDGARKVYTWNNSGTRYQVIWQARDPDYIRVRVTAPNGKEILNRLLSRADDCC